MCDCILISNFTVCCNSAKNFLSLKSRKYFVFLLYTPICAIKFVQFSKIVLLHEIFEHSILFLKDFLNNGKTQPTNIRAWLMWRPRNIYNSWMNKILYTVTNKWIGYLLCFRKMILLPLTAAAVAAHSAVIQKEANRKRIFSSGNIK